MVNMNPEVTAWCSDYSSRALLAFHWCNVLDDLRNFCHKIAEFHAQYFACIQQFSVPSIFCPPCQHFYALTSRTCTKYPILALLLRSFSHVMTNLVHCPHRHVKFVLGWLCVCCFIVFNSCECSWTPVSMRDVQNTGVLKASSHFSS